MKKIEIARQFLTDHLELFRCPVCEQPFVTADEQGLLCPNRHQFDLNKKGTLYFLASFLASTMGKCWLHGSGSFKPDSSMES